ncbi:hypothetical protein BDZ89DRAFT_1045459 [Hymenopellis radicata]|nr:hypothetical protein BDZ89DRAFT_1045459 [Hymenopellis radicata]
MSQDTSGMSTNGVMSSNADTAQYAPAQETYGTTEFGRYNSPDAYEWANPNQGGYPDSSATGMDTNGAVGSYASNSYYDARNYTLPLLPATAPRSPASSFSAPQSPASHLTPPASQQPSTPQPAISEPRPNLYPGLVQIRSTPINLASRSCSSLPGGLTLGMANGKENRVPATPALDSDATPTPASRKRKATSDSPSDVESDCEISGSDTEHSKKKKKKRSSKKTLKTKEKKPGLLSLDGGRQKLISGAMVWFQSLLLHRDDGPWMSSRDLDLVALQAWHKELTLRGITPLLPPSDVELKLITARLVHHRGELITHTKHITKERNNPVWTLVDSVDAADIKKNRDVIAILTKNFAHTFRDPFAMSGFFGCQLLQPAVNQTYFGRKEKSHGLVEGFFMNNEVSFQAIALIFTGFACSLANWEDGHEGKKPFNTDPYSSVYDEILSGLRLWETHCQGIGQPEITVNFRKSLFVEGRKQTGVPSKKRPPRAATVFSSSAFAVEFS